MIFKKWLLKHGPGSVGSVAKTMAKSYSYFKARYPYATQIELSRRTLQSRVDAWEMHGLPSLTEAEQKANIVLDGDFSKTMTSYGSPQFAGYVKNIGNNTGYNCKITIVCFSDVSKINIIDTALGFPADLGDIPPGNRAYFDAVAFNCNSHDEIKAINWEITWLDR